ncbi:MAG TPA: sulfite exporter TauE/SafE family protein, partial [Desulfosarcina sp.]|nr:sulfite exporter TauE/SafE family protein [Desulfosarcina sp.]
MDEPLLLRGFAVVTVVVAGYVRGYGGFGFSMITVAALSLVMPPERIVPVVLILEVAASSFLLPGVWPAVDWRVLRRMLSGVAAGIPLGVWLLGSVPPAPMKMALALIIFTLALLLRQGIVLKRQPGRPTIALVGVTS